jgi:hypothetical protein
MATPEKAIETFKRWQTTVLIVVLIGAGGSAYAVHGRTNGPALDGLAENRELFTSRRGDRINRASTNGSLVKWKTRPPAVRFSEPSGEHPHLLLG